MKFRKRYPDFDITLDLPEDIVVIPMDAMLIEQVIVNILENAIQHGYNRSGAAMKISISSGWNTQGWYLTVVDNGNGFDREKLYKIKMEIAQIKKKLDEASDNIQLEIGGMGIINTYARLYIFFRERLQFDIVNLDSGAQVIIGCQDSPEMQESGGQNV